MADKGILFSAPMVRALLDGHKTQTRRLLRNPEYYGCPTGDCPHSYQAECDAAMAAIKTPWAIGDRLYVREHWSTHPAFDGIAPRDLKRGSMIYTRADDAWHNNGDWIGEPFGKHRQGMHMPRWASRLWLAVEDVSIKLLRDITEADCYAEGLERPTGPRLGSDVTARDNARNWYRAIWDNLHDKPGERWADNPWIVAVGFTVHEGNIDGREWSEFPA